MIYEFVEVGLKYGQSGSDVLTLQIDKGARFAYYNNWKINLILIKKIDVLRGNFRAGQ